jgi:hypothetical protein
MTCEMQGYVAAYLLGAIEPEEARALQGHLDECASCYDEMTAVAWIPSLLPLVAIEDVDALEGATEVAADDAPPPPAMLDRLLATTEGERRSRGFRGKVAVVAAAALVVAGTALAVVDSRHASPARTVHAVDARTHVSATVTVANRSWGTELGLSLRGAYPRGTCSLIAHARDGHTDIAATWVASAQGTADVPGATAIPANQLSELDVVAANGWRLVQIVVPAPGR